VNEALLALEPEFSALYAPIGRLSIPPEKLLRAMLFATCGVTVIERKVLRVVGLVGAQNTSGRSSAIDGRTTRHGGFAIS
jgi:hypothetical protein